MPVPDMQLALATHRVDVGNMPEPFASRSAKTDARIVCSVYDGIGNAWLQNAWVASADWVSANPEVARRFRALVYRTAGWANQHQTETAEMLSQVSSVEIDVIRQTPRARYAEKDSAELLDPVIDVAVKYGLITKRPSARELFAPELRA
jgi:ABC-type nitrate/sulfonate/bicarbonate transport system substrate-binding protein